ncbi:ABC transporter ATP-binding protein [Lysobacter enzymogenes]|uniref:ABC transporter ATP-binding protein n=1 Tax=Lysobacter enzymogenes TaxID=69 RepID=UPI001F615D3F|nr:ABC transporter ATP-binding protein [Lysobacter enzymogenes]
MAVSDLSAAIMADDIGENDERAQTDRNGAAAPARPITLDVRDLGKRVTLPSGELTILDGVGFAIAKGDTVAIVGASGSGKSTLLSLLAGLDSPSAGTVTLDGETISALDEDGRARVRGEKVGFVFQSFQLLPSLTALENVMLPLELRGDRDAQAPARAILDKVGLGQRLDHYPRQLSGGEQQRVALARAFVTRPSLLFADEPTGNLDTHTGQAIIELLFQLNADAGTTLILVTHDDHLAERCHRRIRLDSGRLVRS